MPGQNFNQNLLEIEKRIKIIEQNLDFLKKEINNLETVDAKQEKDIDELKREVHRIESEIKKEISDLKKEISMLKGQIKFYATKDELKVVEKYLDLINPMNFVTANEVKKLVREYVLEYLRRMEITEK